MSAPTLERRAVAVWNLSDSTAELASVLDRGGVLAVPTGSSYALAADPSHAAGVALVYSIKERPPSEPLPVVVDDLSRLDRLGVSGELALGGLERAWPGALSIVLPCAVGIPAAAGRGTLAVRIPGDPRLRELLSRLGRPLTATSANKTGQAPLASPDSLQRLLAGHDAMIVDAGPSSGDEPSTLVSLDGTTVQVLRLGRISIARLRELAPGLDIRPPQRENPSAEGAP